jgi:hypothetical protein
MQFILDDQVGWIYAPLTKNNPTLMFPCDLGEFIDGSDENRRFFTVNIFVDGPEWQAGILGTAKLAFLFSAVNPYACRLVPLVLAGGLLAIPAFAAIQFALVVAKTAPVQAIPF